MRPSVFLLLSLSMIGLETACDQGDIAIVTTEPDCTAEDASLWFGDGDHDGFGDPDIQAIDCDAPDGFVANDLDCNDVIAEINPDADEICDGIDNNCTGLIDDDAVDQGTWFADMDLDAHGNIDLPLTACAQPEGFVVLSDDCDDGQPLAFPGNPELCDSIDNDCNGLVDDDPIDDGIWYADVDLDGFGDDATALDSCDPPTGFISEGGDCDDAEAASFPGNPEVCDGLDNDCDGVLPVDETDTDGDGVRDCDFIDPPICGTTGMTFGISEEDPALGTQKVECTGCDPYLGDTACTDFLPVLCINPQGHPNPGITTDYYNGWSGGDIDNSVPVQGCSLTSLSAADAICESQFGPGWRMGEFHDGGGGWGWHGFGAVTTTLRMWTHIDDQGANCWN